MLRNRWAIALAATLFLALSTPPQNGSGKPEQDQRYLLLAATKTSTIQKELDEAAAEGFRIVVGSPTSGMEMALLLERAAEPPDTYRYRLLATTHTGTMQRELNDAASEGYQLLPRTMISKTAPFLSPEIVVILERPPKVEKRYQYRLLATTKTSTLQKEITDALSEGYIIAGMVSRGEHLVIMEREINLAD